MPVEVFELRTPALVRARTLRPDSAGAGEWRGAFGHRLELSPLPGYPRPVSCFLDPDRLRFPPRGLHGGEDGPCTAITVNGRALGPDDIGSGQITLASPADRLELHIPGGAGYGPPERRDPQLSEADTRSGLVSPSGAPAKPTDATPRAAHPVMPRGF